MQLVDDLVFDVGFHRGEDARFYLSKGYRVVGFEANPTLREAARKNFATEMGDGRLTLVEGAITDDRSITEVEFFVFDRKSEFGTTSNDWAKRNEELGFAGKPVRVPTVDFGACLERFGVPHYCKIDIEGADRVCLNGLVAAGVRPNYVSIESDKTSLDRIDEELDLLEAIGFNRFALVQQATIGHRPRAFHTVDGAPFTHRFASGASGPFGDDLTGEWLPRDAARRAYEAVFTQYERFGDATAWQKTLPLKALTKLYMRLTGRGLPGWYDTHACAR